MWNAYYVQIVSQLTNQTELNMSFQNKCYSSSDYLGMEMTGHEISGIHRASSCSALAIA